MNFKNTLKMKKFGLIRHRTMKKRRDAQRFKPTSNCSISLGAIVPMLTASQNLYEISNDTEKKEIKQMQEEVLNLDEYMNSTSENDNECNPEKEIFIGNMINRLRGFTDKVEPAVTPNISQVSGNLVKLTPDDVFIVLNQ